MSVFKAAIKQAYEERRYDHLTGLLRSNDRSLSMQDREALATLIELLAVDRIGGSRGQPRTQEQNRFQKQALNAYAFLYAKHKNTKPAKYEAAVLFGISEHTLHEYTKKHPQFWKDAKLYFSKHFDEAKAFYDQFETLGKRPGWSDDAD